MSSPSSISSSSSSSSASIRTSTISMDIPIEEESAAVLEYIGFEPSTASEIFQRYTGRPDPDQCPDDLLDYACGQIAVLQSKTYRAMDIQEAMAQVGLTPQIQSAIADPAFSDILWTRDLHFWVEDTIPTNYATLCSRHDKRTSAQGLFPPEEGSAPEAPEPAAVTATVNDVPVQDFGLPSAHVAVLEGDAPTRPNHVVLYKGKAYWHLWGSQRLIEADGSIDMLTLSNPPEAHYWTSERGTAERDREWVARRCPGSDTCLIQIQVSNALIDRLRSPAIWLSADWKEFVGTCKQMHPSPKFDYLCDVDLIKGHISTGMNPMIARIEAAQRPAIQWMFWKPETLNRLRDDIRGKMHIEIFAAGS